MTTRPLPKSRRRPAAAHRSGRKSPVTPARQFASLEPMATPDTALETISATESRCARVSVDVVREFNPVRSNRPDTPSGHSGYRYAAAIGSALGDHPKATLPYCSRTAHTIQVAWVRATGPGMWKFQSPRVILKAQECPWARPFKPGRYPTREQDWGQLTALGRCNTICHVTEG